MAKEKPIRLRLFGDASHNHAFFIAIGQLIIHWANNESLFLRVLVSLMQPDVKGAQIAFHSHKNTTGRLDFVSAMLKAKVDEPDAIAEFKRLVDNFRGLSRKRNFFAHCMYSYDMEADPPPLISASGVIFDNQTQAYREETVLLNAKALREIDNANMKFVELNHRLWSFVRRLDDYLAMPLEVPQKSPDE